MSTVCYVLNDKSPVKLWSFRERNELILSLRSRRNLNPVSNLTCGAGYEKIPVGICFGAWLAQTQCYQPQGSAHTLVWVAGIENSWGLEWREKYRGIGKFWGFSSSPLFPLLVLGPAAQAGSPQLSVFNFRVNWVFFCSYKNLESN